MAINSLNTQGMTRLPQNQDPDAFAQEYATKNGISLDEAKAELKAKYGDPTKPTDIKSTSNFDTAFSQSEDSMIDTTELFASEDSEVGATSSSSSSIAEIITKLMEMINGQTSTNKAEKLPESKDDRDAYAQKFADENGISLDEAKEILASKEPKDVKNN